MGEYRSKSARKASPRHRRSESSYVLKIIIVPLLIFISTIVFVIYLAGQ